MEEYSVGKLIYDAACKIAKEELGELPKSAKDELYYFLHDWSITLEEEIRCKNSGEESPSEMFERFKKVFDGKE